MSSIKLNLAKVLDVEPSPISCMSLNHRCKKLALFRGGSVGVIEIWDVEHQPCLEKIISQLEAIDGKPSVESIIWAQGRLFSCGLHGFVLEHDVCTGSLKSKSAATSGPVWCLAVNPSQTVIAAGTEDGFVNLFQIEDQGLTYIKVLDRQDGRVLCLQWSPCGRYIATGSIDSVRLWDVEKGHAVQRLMTGRTKNKETIVWSILVLDDLTLVSGDSRGVISFWDGRIGVLKFKIQSHKADVLALKLSTDKSCIYAAGVDPIVLLLTKISGSDKWVKSHPRNIHVNDVLCLETYGNRLFSGGIDADLGMSSFPPKIIVKYPPIPKQSSICGSSNSKSLLIKHIKGLSVWKLPDNITELTKILEMSTKAGDDIFSVALSPSGTSFGYSTLNTVKFFQLDYDCVQSKTPLKPVISKIKLQDSSDFPSSYQENFLSFLNENTVIVIDSSGKQASFVKIDKASETATWSTIDEFEAPDSQFGVGLVTVSEQQSCIAITFGNRVVVYSVSNSLRVSKYCDIPLHRSLPTAVAFHPKLPFILITYVDHLVQVVDYKVGRIRYQEFPKKMIDDLQPFQGATWSPNGESAILFQNDSLSMLEMIPDEEPQTKSRKTKSKPGDTEKFRFQIKSCPTKYKYLAHVGAYNDDQEFVAVEVDPNSMLDKLPPAFAKKRFGS